MISLPLEHIAGVPQVPWFGFQVSDSWFIGYGYDMETTRLANFNSDHMKYFFVTKYSKVITKSHHLDSSNLI
jgi:hypothetical protein